MSDQGRDERQCVVMVGFDNEVAAVLESMLEEEGYRARIIASGQDVVHGVVQADASVVLVALGRRGESLALIDRLRTSEATVSLPVIALTTLPSQHDEARASGNVSALLGMPFDMDDLLDALGGVLSRTPFEARVRSMPAETDHTRVRGAEILLHAERDIVLGWLQRIRSVEPYASRTDLTTREFLDTVPRILNGLILLLRHGPRPEILHSDEDARGRIRSHALFRRGQGLGAEAVVREYQLLREVIRERLQQEMPAEAVLGVLADIHAVLDQAVQITVAELEKFTNEAPNSAS